jgi:YhcH/YjgK/YiaL family protein
MILDTLSNASSYEGLHPSLGRAFAWLSTYDSETPDGRYEITGPSLVAIVQRYITAPAESKKWETHRLHGDVQYLAEGVEGIGYAARSTLAVKTPYNPQKDAELYEPPAVFSTRLELNAGSFAIFFPHDGHQPGVMVDAASPVHKVVIKFLL